MPAMARPGWRSSGKERRFAEKRATTCSATSRRSPAFHRAPATSSLSHSAWDCGSYSRAVEVHMSQPKILIVYATSYGQTQKIALRMRDHLVTAGLDVEVANVDDFPPEPDLLA